MEEKMSTVLICRKIYHLGPEDGDRRFPLYTGNLYHFDMALHPNNTTTSVTHLKCLIYIYIYIYNVKRNIHEGKEKLTCTMLHVEKQNTSTGRYEAMKRNSDIKECFITGSK